MRSIQSLIATAAIAAAGLLLPLQADAQTVITITKPGVAFAGQAVLSGVNTAVFALQPTDGTPCQIFPLGTAGLSTNYRVDGTNGLDWWTHVNTPGVFCGLSMTKLVQNGFFIDYNTLGGGDVVFGGYGPNYITGGAGNDGMSNGENASARAFGGDGDDILKAGLSTSRLFGENNNDALCNTSGTALHTMDGGSGTDSRCGTATNVISIESVNCTPCM